MAPQYRWAYPADWLHWKAQNETDVWCRQALVSITTIMLDSDQIQYLFQREMDEDGYFDELGDEEE